MPHKRLTHLTHLTRNPENSSELMQPQLHYFFFTSRIESVREGPNLAFL